MRFILSQMRMLGSVGVIMACAAGGTIGLLKMIQGLNLEDGVSKIPEIKIPRDQDAEEDE